MQRYATADSDKAARNSVWLGALLYIPVSAMLFLVGTGLFAFYTAQPGLLHESIAKGDQVVPHFIATQLPVGITGLLVAAVLAAAMSSVDSSLNGSATLTWCDLVKRFSRKEQDEASAMKVLHGATIFYGILGTCAALAMIRVESALDAWWKISSIFSGGILGLFLLGLIVHRATSVIAATAVTIGVLVIFWLSAAGQGWLPLYLKPALHANLTIVVGTLTIFLVGLLVSSVRRRAVEIP